MQALRKIMVADDLNINLLKKLKGSLSKYANVNLRNLEKKAFEMEVEENYKKGKYNVKNYRLCQCNS
jgi:hypothetical protein